MVKDIKSKDENKKLRDNIKFLILNTSYTMKV